MPETTQAEKALAQAEYTRQEKLAATPTAELLAALSAAERDRVVESVRVWEITRPRDALSTPTGDSPELDGKFLVALENRLGESRRLRGLAAASAKLALDGGCPVNGRPFVFWVERAVQADSMVVESEGLLARGRAWVNDRPARKAAQAEAELTPTARRLAQLERKLAKVSG